MNVSERLSDSSQLSLAKIVECHNTPCELLKSATRAWRQLYTEAGYCVKANVFAHSHGTVR